MAQIYTRGLREEVLLVTVAGEIDIMNADQLKSSLLELLKEGHGNLIVNFEDLEFIDSNGIRALLAANSEAKMRGAAVCIVTSRSHHNRVFKISGLADEINVFSTQEEAMERMAKSSPCLAREVCCQS